MINFKLKNQEIWEEKSEEERKEILENRERMKESIIERVDFDLIEENVHAAGRVTKCTAILRTDKENKLKFEVIDRRYNLCGNYGYYGYYYDSRFVAKIIKCDNSGKFMFDMGADIGLDIKEMKNVIKAFETTRLNKEIPIEGDYFPMVTEMCKGTHLY